MKLFCICKGLQNKKVEYFSVVLKGGNSSKEGNVFVLNRETKLFGPVCDDYWSFNDVRKALKVFAFVMIFSFRLR